MVYAQDPLFFYLPKSDVRLLTEFGSGVEQDSIFIRYGQVGTDGLSLRVERPDGVACKFVLQRFVSGSWQGSFEQVASVDGVTSHLFEHLSPGGYRILSTVGSNTLSEVVWCFVDDVSLERIDIDNRCDALTLHPRFNYSTDAIRYEKFVYYNHRGQHGTPPIDALGKNYFKEVVWEPSGPGAPKEVLGLNPRIADPPLLEPASFRLRVVNVFGREFKGEAGPVDPVSVQANLSVELNENAPFGKPEDWRIKSSPVQGQSPFAVRMLAEVKNADGVELLIRNDAHAVRNSAPDTLYLRDTPEDAADYFLPDPALFRAGSYSVLLTARNRATGCQDTVRAKLLVDSSRIQPRAIPNAFSPNGDGVNDYFQFIEPLTNIRSIDEFRVQVFNRNGQCVYDYQGNPHQWPGWDGTVGKGRGKASAGVYFFVIKARGWDGRDYWGGEYKGPLHLFL